MTDAGTDTLRAELTAALELLEPAIRGDEDLAKVSFSPATIAFINQRLAAQRRRRILCGAVINGMDDLNRRIAELDADGYPDTPEQEVPSSVFEEIQEQFADMEAARAGFVAEQLASSMSVSLGSKADKP